MELVQLTEVPYLAQVVTTSIQTFNAMVLRTSFSLYQKGVEVQQALEIWAYGSLSW